MKITKLLLVCMCCIVIAPAVWGQTASGTEKYGILGYLDPRTGAFRPVPAATEDGPDPAALTNFGGTITVTLNITLKTAGLTNILCNASVAVTDNVTTTSPRFYNEQATASATGTGTTMTCKLAIPYSWALATQPSDSMTTRYEVFANPTTSGGIQRSSSLSPLDTRKVLANGATTALTAAVTL